MAIDAGAAALRLAEATGRLDLGAATHVPPFPGAARVHTLTLQRPVSGAPLTGLGQLTGVTTVEVVLPSSGA